jgi:ADP-ribose pyrophosphatase YjhB (NUDIX family)
MDLTNVKVSATVIVISKDRKALILQRKSDESYANLWTVAGGGLQDTDGEYHHGDLRYFSVEECVKRELFEETRIHIWYMSIHYFCSVTATWRDRKLLVLSFYIIMDKDAKDLKITLSEHQAYRWIEEYEIPQYGFIPNIGDEIQEVLEN